MPVESMLVLGAFVMIASAFDLRSRRIPNLLVVSGLASALIWHMALGGWQGLSTSLVGFAIGLALMLPGWLLRFTGGGDVKLLAAVGAFVGSPTVFYAFALSMIIGAVIAIAYSVFAWALRGAASPLDRYGTMLTALVATGRMSYIRPEANEAVGRRFPLAPAIGLGSMGSAIWLS